LHKITKGILHNHLRDNLKSYMLYVHLFSFW
jgi:hypothetical protein